MTATDPAIPARCTCPHFENEHTEGGGPCRGTTVDLSSGIPQPAGCSCPAFTPRAEPARRRAATETRTGERLPEQISGRVLAIRDKAAEAGRIVTTEEQQRRDSERTRRDGEHRRTTEARRASEVLDGLPTRYRDALPTHPAVLEWVDHYTAGGTDSLLVLGPTGTGKTHQSFGAFAAAVRASELPGMWISSPDLFEVLRPGRPGVLSVEDFQRTPLLFLDDLAVEKGSAWTDEVLYRLLNYRYSWCLPSIITVNVPPSEVRQSLGDRIASRLNGMGRRVVLDGEDRRTPGQIPLG